MAGGTNGYQEGLGDDAVSKKVVDITCGWLGLETNEVFRASSYVMDLGAESLDTVQLALEYEDAFDISFSREESDGMMTVGTMIDYIKKKITEKKQPLRA